MTKEDEAEVQRLLKNVDVTELMDMLMKHGNRYSRRILKFFRWFCKYVPVVLMCFHAYGIWEFSQHHREMFIPYAENAPCYIYIYFMVYVLPMVAILASRFFFLCWRYRIPFFLLFRHQRSSHRGVELVHNQQYDRFLLYGYDCNSNVLYIRICRYVY